MPNKFIDIQSNENSILDSASFMCVRTNPKLTTNVKLVTNGDRIWLDSFSASKELSEDRYKAYEVSHNGLYNRDLREFYRGVDKDVAYVVHQDFDDLTIKTNYEQQYETMYWCGAERINSLEFDEELGILAPLWINKNMPSYFVVFKLDGPSYLNIREWEKTHSGELPPELNGENLRKQILEKCKIIRTFNLKETNFGKYLTRYVQQEDFPFAPLKMSFENGEETIFSGISLERGCFLSAREYNHAKYFEEDIPIKSLDEFITNGFFRNGLACANLLNIQFLFNDDTAEDYTIGRYFGLYCNEIPDGRFEVDLNSVWFCNENAEEKKGGVVKNKSGVLLPVVQSGELNNFPTADVLEHTNCVFCAKDINGNFHKLNACNSIGQTATTFVRLAETEIGIGGFDGYVKTNLYANAEIENGGRQSQIEFTVLDEIPPHTSVSFWIDGETNPICEISSDYAPGQNYEPTMVPGWYEHGMFCGSGTLEQIAECMANAVNSTNCDTLTATSLGNTVIVAAKCGGTVGNLYYAVVENESDALRVSGLSHNGCSRFSGGTTFSTLVVKKEDAVIFEPGRYLSANTREGYCKILSCVPNTDGETYCVVVDTDGVTTNGNNQAAVYEKYVPSYGRLGFYPVRDFDFSTDTPLTAYGDIGELETEYNHIPSLASENSSSALEASNAVMEFTFQIDGEEVAVEIECEEGVVVTSVTPTVSGSDVTLELLAEAVEPRQIPEIEPNTFNFRFETLRGMVPNGNDERILSEYNRYFENYNRELMLLSRTQPHVCKWVCTDNGLDVREKPYRFNTNLAFGQNSFSPNPYNLLPSTADFNQEWTYIMDNHPFADTSIPNTWSYTGGRINDIDNVASIEDFEALFERTDKNYFEHIFVRDYGYKNDEYSDHLDYKRMYSIFEHGSNRTNSETFFRGARVEIVQKADIGEVLDNNVRNIKTVCNGDLNGYRFSVLTVRYSQDNENECENRKTRIIRNDVFKFVVVLVYVIDKITEAKHIIDEQNYASPVTMGYTSLPLTRYVLYDPETAIGQYIDPSENVNVFGTGYIERVEYVSGPNENRYHVHGRNTNFLTDLDVGENGEVSQILLISNYEEEGASKGIVQLQVVEIISNSEVAVMLAPQNVFGQLPANYYEITEVGLGGSYFSTKYLVVGKKRNVFANQLKNCTFGNIYYNINHFQKNNTVYIHVEDDGTTHSSEKGEYTFALVIGKPCQNAKYNYVELSCDNNHVYYSAKANNAIQINRQGWYGMPLFYDVLKFRDPYVKEVSSNNNTHRGFLENSRYCNTEFAFDYKNFGIVKNLNYHRTNPTNNNVFNLANGDMPIYPISNRFSIGIRDVQSLCSNWDPYYYVKTNSNTSETLEHGTLCMTEAKSMLGSKYLKTPNEITMETFVPKGQAKYPDFDVEVKGGMLTITANVEQRITRHFEQYLRPMFETHVSEVYSFGSRDTVYDDVDEYIRKNILQRYVVKSAELYIREEAVGGFDIIPDCTFSNVKNTQKQANGLRTVCNVSVVSIGENGFDKKFEYRVKNGYKYYIGISVKIVEK